ncbi:Thermophilic serine proteinase precursor [Planctomycetes bacterium Poly30]|uniref:Thermophilic serine proteinase n=1 Tax=Saltatorellus ferox TaxID=2528018 RepID=A0A518EVD7_9BACT|nr:Thermophilic serine proteinase precursor [Planctomycetes bacterium Poly30]
MLNTGWLTLGRMTAGVALVAGPFTTGALAQVAPLDTTPILQREVTAGPTGPDGQQLPSYLTRQVLVRLSAGLSEDARAAILGAGNGADRYGVERAIVPQMDLYLVQILDGTSVSAAMQELSGRDGVLYAVPDHVVTNRDTFPNDSQFGQQYGKHNTGQTGGTPDADIDAPKAWDYSTGTSEFAVAIVDGGVDHAHPDLIGNRWENAAEANGQPGVDDDGNGYVDDVYGWNAYNNNANVGTSSHGTHVAGIAAAQGDNGFGVAGVSWDAEIVSIAGSSGTTSTVMIAYSYALALKDQWMNSGGAAGANIVATNSSFGVDFANCSSPNFTPWNDMYDLMGQSGILSATATTNSAQNVDNVGDVPTGCGSDYMISVTATNDEDRRTFSGFGLTTIDLGAPGASIRSTLPGNSYGPNTGTSMATPQVTGAIALLHSAASPEFANLRAANPAMAALEIKRILMETVDVVPTLDGFTVSGGRMNVGAAAEEINTYGAAIFNYCGPAIVNSTSQSASMSYLGSSEVALNDLSLVAQGLPSSSVVLFIASRTQGFVAFPGGSTGNLCLGGSVGRFQSQVASTGTGSSVTIAIDLNAVPQPNGSVAAMPGDTWNFQAWYRDSLIGIPITNFTDGLSVFVQ